MATAFTLAASTPRIFFAAFCHPPFAVVVKLVAPSHRHLKSTSSRPPLRMNSPSESRLKSLDRPLSRPSWPDYLLLSTPRFLHLIIRVLTRAAAHLSKVSWLFFIFKIQNHMFGPGPGHSVQHTCLSSSSRLFPPTSTLTASSSTYDGTIMMAIMC